MKTKLDHRLETLYKEAAKRPQRKNEDTLTKFDRNIYWYNKDGILRQSKSADRITYEDHRKAIETAVTIYRMDTQHDIAMCILSHRFFKDYRDKIFAGKGDFTKDYSFLLKKIVMIFNAHSGRIAPTNIKGKLAEYKEPTLVQVNHVSGDISTVNVPDTGETLNEWAIKFNKNANETTTYYVTNMGDELKSLGK